MAEKQNLFHYKIKNILSHVNYNLESQISDVIRVKADDEIWWPVTRQRQIKVFIRDQIEGASRDGRTE